VAPVVPVALDVSVVLPARVVAVAPVDAVALPLPGLLADGTPPSTVVLVVVGRTGPPDAALLVDVDAPGGGASCTSPVGGGSSVSKAELLSSGEPQAAGAATTRSATSSFNVRIVAPSLRKFRTDPSDRDADEENEASPPDTSRLE
jgi:hypothetical protein